MLENLLSQIAADQTLVRSILPVGVGFGALVLFFGIASALKGDDQVLARMRGARQILQFGQGGERIVKQTEEKPKGLLRALIPDDSAERTQITLQLRQAGLKGANAIRNFFLVRLGLAVAGPSVLFGLFTMKNAGLLSILLEAKLNDLSDFNVLQILIVTLAAGFYLPGFWLKKRIEARKARIEEAFPNTLDLLQVSVEAGMGFDSAMTRVGGEMARVCPEVSAELLLAQQEILAGRERETTLFKMAERLAVEEAISFVNVIVQSMQYGTNISDALNGYAKEMRENRELRAQERANKLPVQMSAVMAVLMLPALFLITLGPTIIRYVNM